jgi:hypothetical protein
MKLIVLTSEKDFESLNEKEKGNDKDMEMIQKRALWKVIAKNEIRIRTSKFRNHRWLLFVGIYAVLFLWAFLIAPILFDFFMPTLASEFSAIFLPLVGIIIESLMIGTFLVLVMYPLNTVYREGEVGFKEVLMTTPIKSNDIFLGEYLGKAPIFSIGVLILGPVITGLLNPITNLTIFQYSVIYGSIFVMVCFANLIGSILASWIEHKITKSEKARDLGKALIWIFTIALVGVMYAVIFFLNELLANPELKNWLVFYPSIWFSNIILYSIEPSLTDTFILNIWINLILAIGIPLLVLYLSYHRAESFYTLEGGFENDEVVIMKQENGFYKFIQKITGKKWGGLVVMQFKRFLRKKANYARLAYVYGLLGFMTWFISRMESSEFGIIFSSTIIIAIGGAIGSIIIGHLAFIESKDIIWVYKRSPRGIKSLAYSYLVMMLVFNIFLSMFITTFYAILTNIDILNIIIFFAEFLVFSQISSIQAMGLQCKSPAYGDKDPNMRGNAMISMLLLQPLMFLPIGLLILLDPQNAFTMRLVMQVPIFLYMLAVTIPLFIYGMKKLDKLE